jgi:hypothetical protein
MGSVTSLFRGAPAAQKAIAARPGVCHKIKRETALLLLAPYPPEAMTAYCVSPLVNNPANDSIACQSPGS